MAKDLYGNETKGDVFCDIAAGKAPCYKVWEDADYMAILDIFPNTPGVTLVMPKKHVPSYAFALTDEQLSSVMLAAKKVAKLLEERLGAKRIHLVFEGTGIDHLHVKLYPAHGLERRDQMVLYKGETFNEKYPGMVTTISGPRAKEEDLREMQKKITGR